MSSTNHHEEGLASNSSQVYYLSMECLPADRWEASPVVFTIKTVVGQEPDWDDWDDSNPPSYAVHHFSVEPVKGGRTGTPCLWRVFPDVVGLKPTEKGALPQFEVSELDSKAQFYFPVPIPAICGVHELCQDLLQLCLHTS